MCLSDIIRLINLINSQTKFRRYLIEGAVQPTGISIKNSKVVKLVKMNVLFNLFKSEVTALSCL